jgi:hypothetical protein
VHTEEYERNEMSIENVTTWIGTGVMAAGGIALTAAFLGLASLATWHYANSLWKSLTTIYKFHTIQYWFERMSRNGTHVLRKEHDEKLAEQEDA